MPSTKPTLRSQRRPTNVSPDHTLDEEGRALALNLPYASERGIAEQLAGSGTARWTHENRDALASSNAFIDAHGLPLAGQRHF